VIWRSVVVALYIGLGLFFGVVCGGGPIVLAFFAVWGLVWGGFSLFWRWADETRRRLVQTPASN
jgi:hypothetical protein